MIDFVNDSPIGPQQAETTFGKLGTLAPLPLPTLEQTLQRFIVWCEPLLTAQELAQTKTALEAFQPLGEQLQQCLLEYQRSPEVYSWLDRFWPARYLGRRVPLAINANFVFTLADADIAQLQRAAQLTYATTRYKLLLDQELIPSHQIRGKPLCMLQQKYLFATCRIPGEQRDSVISPYSRGNPGAAKARHILVIHNRRIFQLDVIDAQGHAYSQRQIELALAGVMKHSDTLAAESESPGLFTTMARRDWAETRAYLLQFDANNATQMQHIEQALFVVCLDEAAPQTALEATDQLLHGDGANRWYDKSISLIIFSNGVAGVNIEHCGLDGGTVIAFVDALFTEQLNQPQADSTITPPAPLPVTFTLDQQLTDTLATAAANFHQCVEKTASRHFHFPTFGSGLIKTFGTSPDAFVQMAFQLAHYRTKGFIGTTYESVATRHFERGRTEAMRVVSNASRQFVLSMEEPSASSDEKRQAFLQATEAHMQRIRQCQQGEAPEQHLWQLQMIAQQWPEGEAISGAFPPAAMQLFQSPGWQKLRDDYLSTSSVPSVNVNVFGFGATSPQCIGVAYRVSGEEISAYLSTPKSVAVQMDVFAEQLAHALQELANLMIPEEPSK